MGKHKVKLHKWINGILHSIEHEFKSHREAHNFAEKADCHIAKIIADDGSIVNEIKGPALDSPATTDYA